jgi:hypothetical protein
VAEQLADGDLVAVGQDPGQPALQRVRQRQPALGDQLQDDGGDQRLGQAAGAEAQPGLHGPAGGDVCDAGGGLQAPVLILDPGGGAGRPRRHQPVHQSLQLLQLHHYVPPTRNQVTISPLPLTATSPRRWNR